MLQLQSESYVLKAVLSTAAGLTVILGAGASIDHTVPATPPASETNQYVHTQGSRGDLASPILGNYQSTDLIGVNPNVVSVIGANGVERLATFARLSPGWDGKDSRSLSTHSLKRLSEFCSRFDLKTRDIATFMSHAGNVVINWHDAQGGLVEMEFLPTSIECYVEIANLDESLSLDEDGMSKVYERIRAHVLA